MAEFGRNRTPQRIASKLEYFKVLEFAEFRRNPACHFIVGKIQPGRVPLGVSRHAVPGFERLVRQPVVAPAPVGPVQFIVEKGQYLARKRLVGLWLYRLFAAPARHRHDHERQPNAGRVLYTGQGVLKTLRHDSHDLVHFDTPFRHPGEAPWRGAHWRPRSRGSALTTQVT